MNKKREHFSSRFALIAAVAGSAVGLGNIWKFPYILGENGGNAFMLIYIICIIILGMPLMIAEFVIGRRSQHNSFRAFKILAPRFKLVILGILPFIISFIVMSYYTTISGWTLEYITKSLLGSYSDLSASEINNNFETFTTSIISPIIWQLCFILLTGTIVYFGIKRGIEGFSKIIMPVMVVLMLIMCIKSLTLDNAWAGIVFLFKPDFSKITPTVVLMAMGHAFFSLSVGFGMLITYASYMNKKGNIIKTVTTVVIADTLIAILAGIIIFPAVFSFGIDPKSGPGLVFVTLPNIFNQMSGGSFFAILFFIFLGLAALTSTIAGFEVLVSVVKEELGLSREKSTIITVIAIMLFGMLCTLSMSVMKDEYSIWGMSLFGALDHLSSNWLLPLSGLFSILFLGFIMKTKDVKAELTNDGDLSIAWFGVLMFIVRYVTPLGIVVVLLNQLGLF